MKTKIFIILIAIFGLISCNNTNNTSAEGEEHGEEGVVELSKKQEKALGLELGQVQQRNLTTVVKINGELSVPPSSSANITAVIGGNIKKISVFQGDKVKKGQQLVVLEHPDYISMQEDFAVIAHNLEYLEQEYKRQKELYEKNVGSGKDYQKAKAEYNTANAKYEGLKSRLLLLGLSPKQVKEGKISNTVRISSPLNGYVSEINIKVGTYVDAKDIIMEVTDNNDLHADFKVYEKDVHLIKQGQKIHFTVSNNPQTEYIANVFAIGKEFDKNSRSITIHANINEKSENIIPGMYITGHLHADKKHTNALPNEAITMKGIKSYVFVLVNDEDEHEHMHEHGDEDEHDEEAEGHEDKDSFKMMEVITGVSDDGYTEVTFVEPLPENVQIVMNVAYYLLAEMGKDEVGDDD